MTSDTGNVQSAAVERYHFACGAHLLLRAAAGLGVAEGDVLREAEVPRGQLPPGACRIPWSKLRAVTDAALRLTGEPALGLIAGMKVLLDDFGIPGCYLINMPTVEQAMRFGWTEVYPYTSNMFCMHADPGESAAQIHIETTGHADPLFDPHVHIFMGKHVAATRAILGTNTPFTQIRLRARNLGDPTRLSKLTGVPVVTGQPEDCLVMPWASLRRPINTSHPWVREMLRPQFDAFMRDMKADRMTTLSVVSALERQLAAGVTPELTTVAEALRINPRTLRSRLAAEGTSFRDVLDEARKGLVMQHLAAPGVKLAAVAVQLGFSDQASFTRAFRRWTGHSPTEWIGTHTPPQ